MGDANGMCRLCAPLTSRRQYVHHGIVTFLLPWCLFRSCAQPIPSRVIHDGDVTKFRVCLDAAQFLDAMWTTPVLDVEASFPDVWRACKRLQSLKRTRKRFVTAVVRPRRVWLAVVFVARVLPGFGFSG